MHSEAYQTCHQDMASPHGGGQGSDSAHLHGISADYGSLTILHTVLVVLKEVILAGLGSD